MTRTGRCLCGATTFTAEGEPEWVTFCHCESCRRATSSPATVFACFPAERVVFQGDTLQEYASSPGVTRSFCGTCGSPLSYRTDERADQIDLYVAAFDAPEDLRPTRHDFYGERLSWMIPGDGLPTRE
ncbi:GFA family protein [Pararhizobium mangrovi]|uniref:GFA family protein n=1 Tax=Pararhizobium mangrovi TaxID=2590452 RepID=A0A506U029_9HYPH|nr:GFA family protein [Pararhizobium mangrovi]TPW27130.1 GFA family protein [Pararhizobium mangrovi]